MFLFNLMLDIRQKVDLLFKYGLNFAPYPYSLFCILFRFWFTLFFLKILPKHLQNKRFVPSFCLDFTTIAVYHQ
jgi:hypothetical protein